MGKNSLNMGFSTKDGTPVPGFLSTLIADYINNLDRFFDTTTGAVQEPTRDDQTPAFLFSEVTGYAIRNLLLLHSLTGDDSYLHRAEKAARWLTETAMHKGWIRTRYYLAKDKEEAQQLYSFHWGNILPFDNGICLGGLAALCKATRNPIWLKYTTELADNLVKCVQADGSIEPFINIYGNHPGLPEPLRWSQQKGSFHTKIAESLVEFAKITGNETYRDAACKICEYALSFQQEDGRFITDQNGITQLHPHCYSTEGIFYVGLELGDKKLVAAARRAVEWALSQCVGDNKNRIPQEIGPQGPLNLSYRTDALAQVLGLGCRLIRGGHLDDSWWETLSALADGVWSMKDPVQKYFRYGTYEYGEQSETLSYWTNMFAFHGLLDYCTAWVSRHTAAVILAGGIGSRCWPVSCEDNPKPLSKGFFGDSSLLELTASRILNSGCVLPENLFVVASSQGLTIARKQMAQLHIPPENMIEERVPSGTVPALNLAVNTITSKGKELLLVSMADNLIEPALAFGDTVLRASMAAHWQSQEGQATIVSLSIPDRPFDNRFGHDIYRQDHEMLRRVYRDSRFVEKPSTSPVLKQGEAFSWNSGSIVSTLAYFKTCLAELQEPGPNNKDISYCLLENPKVSKSTALYPGNVRFVDLGSPGKDLLAFFAGSEYTGNAGNIVLGSKTKDVVFVNASRNLVIYDGIPIEVVGISDHLIIDNSFTSVAVVLPFSRVETLPQLYNMFKNSRELAPFIKGGIKDPAHGSHHMAFECHGQCQTHSDYGLALAVYCTDIRIERSQNRLRVVDTRYLKLDNHEIDIVMSKKSDPRLARHLLDVETVARMLAERIGFTPEALHLLRLLSLCHDIGGYLTDQQIALERELEKCIHDISNLDWRTIDSQVLLKLVHTRAGDNLTPPLEKLLATFNDNVQSALHVLDIEKLKAYPLLDELLFLICNQERPADFRLPLPFPPIIAPEDLIKVFACFKVAESWVHMNCTWKKTLRPFLWEKKKGKRKEEDIAQYMVYICRVLEDARVTPQIYLDAIHSAMLVRPESDLYVYTCTHLRCFDQLDGNSEQTPFYPSDKVYLEFMRYRRDGGNLEDRVSKPIHDALTDERDFVHELLFLLPYHLKLLEKYNLADPREVKNLAFLIMQSYQRESPSTWENVNLEKARNTLIDCLK